MHPPAPSWLLSVGLPGWFHNWLTVYPPFSVSNLQYACLKLPSFPICQIPCSALEVPSESIGRGVGDCPAYMKNLCVTNKLASWSTSVYTRDQKTRPFPCVKSGSYENLFQRTSFKTRERPATTRDWHANSPSPIQECQISSRKSHKIGSLYITWPKQFSLRMSTSMTMTVLHFWSGAYCRIKMTCPNITQDQIVNRLGTLHDCYENRGSAKKPTDTGNGSLISRMLNSKGWMIKLKACRMVRGFKQWQGIDFTKNVHASSKSCDDARTRNTGREERMRDNHVRVQRRIFERRSSVSEMFFVLSCCSGKACACIVHMGEALLRRC